MNRKTLFALMAISAVVGLSMSAYDISFIHSADSLPSGRLRSVLMRWRDMERVCRLLRRLGCNARTRMVHHCSGSHNRGVHRG